MRRRGCLAGLRSPPGGAAWRVPGRGKTTSRRGHPSRPPTTRPITSRRPSVASGDMRGAWPRSAWCSGVCCCSSRRCRRSSSRSSSRCSSRPGSCPWSTCWPDRCRGGWPRCSRCSRSRLRSPSWSPSSACRPFRSGRASPRRSTRGSWTCRPGCARAPWGSPMPSSRASMPRSRTSSGPPAATRPVRLGRGAAGRRRCRAAGLRTPRGRGGAGAAERGPVGRRNRGATEPRGCGVAGRWPRGPRVPARQGTRRATW